LGSSHNEGGNMHRDLAGRRILITGASSGIGRSLAEQAAAGGARVAAAARTREKLDELARDLAARGADVLPVAADVTSADDRRRLLDTVADRLGGLDVLVNNAGVAAWGHFSTSSEDLLRRVMEVNFFAPAELIRSAVPLLAGGTQPAVVNVSSMCGRRGMPAWPEYSASKFALAGLTEALRAELARFGIDVLLVVPGLTRSDLPRNFLRNEGREQIRFEDGMPPEAVARRILGALRRNVPETVLGREAFWMLLANRFFPRAVDWLIARRVRQLYAR
jgi:NAD(P)-dependent dehydrogenase (short-subunit alcohol dehydrogenase family)